MVRNNHWGAFPSCYGLDLVVLESRFFKVAIGTIVELTGAVVLIRILMWLCQVSQSQGEWGRERQ